MHVPYAAYLCIDGKLSEGRTDIIEESITALGHLYGEIKGAQTAVQLNDGHYVNKKMTGRASEQRSLEVNLLNQVVVDQNLLLRVRRDTHIKFSSHIASKSTPIPKAY